LRPEGESEISEQSCLRDVFAAAHAKGALQMLSNPDPTNYSADSFFDDMYNDFNIHRIMAKRLINSNADNLGEIR
jgi:DNA adenine methylase